MITWLWMLLTPEMATTTNPNNGIRFITNLQFVAGKRIGWVGTTKNQLRMRDHG